MNTVQDAPVPTERVDTAQLRAELLKLCKNAGFSPCGKITLDEEMPFRSNPRLCFGMECLDRKLWDPFPAMDELKKLGIHRTRLQSGWARTETERGVYDFSWLDEITDKLLSIGITPWLSLSYGNPLWDTTHQAVREYGLGHIPLHNEDEKNAWRRYVKAAVEHYKDRIQYYEIWNEPDVKSFFPYGEGWEEAYIELCRISAEEIRAAYPEAKIVVGTSNKERMVTLLQRGIGMYADVVCFHAYFPLPESYTKLQHDTLAEYVHAVNPKLEIWRGEAGCPSFIAIPGRGALSNMQTSEIIQAKWQLRHLLCDLADKNMNLTSYFHVYNFEHFTHELHFYYGFLRDGDYSRKPSYETLQLLARLIDGDTVPFTECVTVSADSEVYVTTFRRHNSPLIAYWKPTQPENNTVYTVCRLENPFLPIKWRCPVVIDPITRAIYKADMTHLPLCDYPMIVCELDTLENLTDCSDLLPNPTETVTSEAEPRHNKQIHEE